MSAKHVNQRARVPFPVVVLLKGMICVAATLVVTESLLALSDYCDSSPSPWLSLVPFTPAIIGVGLSIPGPTFGSQFAGGFFSTLVLEYAVIRDMHNDAQTSSLGCEASAGVLVVVPVCLAVVLAACTAATVSRSILRRLST